MTAKELLEKRAVPGKAVKDLTEKILKEGRRPTDEEKKNLDQWNADYDGLTDQIVLAQRAEQIDADAKRQQPPPEARPLPQPGQADIAGQPDDLPADGQALKRISAISPEQREEYRVMAMESWFKFHGPEAIEPDQEHTRAIKAIGFNLNRRFLEIPHLPTPHFRKAQDCFRDGGLATAESRALSALVGASGGNLVPQTLVNTLDVALLAFGGMMQAATVTTTASGETMTIPTMDDTSQTGAQLGEGAAVTEANPSFAGDQWTAYKFTSKYIDVPFELLQDATGFDLVSILGQALGTRIGRILNTKFTTGSGAGTPKGAVIAATAVKTTASATAITWAELNDMIHGIDPAYRTGSKWMAHDTIYKAIENLTDSALGRPLWMAGPNGVAPMDLRGYPWIINQDMASSVASTNITMLFGRLDRYRIRLVGSTRVYRLVEAQRLNDLDRFLAFARADGNYLGTGGTTSLGKLTQAT